MLESAYTRVWARPWRTPIWRRASQSARAVSTARTTSARLSTSRCCGGGSSHSRSTCCAAMPAWRARSTDSVTGIRLRTRLGSMRFRRSSCSLAALSDMATSWPSWRTTSGQDRLPPPPARGAAAWSADAVSPASRRRAPGLGVNQLKAMCRSRACCCFGGAARRGCQGRRVQNSIGAPHGQRVTAGAPRAAGRRVGAGVWVPVQALRAAGCCCWPGASAALPAASPRARAGPRRCGCG